VNLSLVNSEFVVLLFVSHRLCASECRATSLLIAPVTKYLHSFTAPYTSRCSLLADNLNNERIIADYNELLLFE